MLGYLIGDRDAVRDYETWYDQYVETVEERVSAILEEERPRVFMERESTDKEASVRWAYASDTGYTDLCEVAGEREHRKGEDRLQWGRRGGVGRC